MPTGITHLIVNSPYDEPKHHWHYRRVTQKFFTQTDEKLKKRLTVDKRGAKSDEARRVGEGCQQTRRIRKMGFGNMLQSIRLADGHLRGGGGFGLEGFHFIERGT